MWGKPLAEKCLRKNLELRPVQASAPCRVDCGGTLDIKTFYYPLRKLGPCTFNIALSLKTRVHLRPYETGSVMVSSKGFETEVHAAHSAPFNSPLGLMFAVAAYFSVGGVHIDVVSESPPRSALGGSSTAAVALIGALSRALSADGYAHFGREKIVLTAHALEEAVAGVPCGLQDQLAAAYGGVHAWYWPWVPTEPAFRRQEVLSRAEYGALEKRFLVAYCGIPHESRDINSKWVEQFVAGKNRTLWAEIADTTGTFVRALGAKDWTGAVEAMNKEVEIRRTITPEVFDELGEELLTSALACGCGARFAGAGGGGCIWALGEKDNIVTLRSVWRDILSQREGARLLEARVDGQGLAVES